MLNVGYRINQDQSALFSYTYHGTAMTLDPVSTAGPGWAEFLDAYNQFCSDNGASPLFNQTARLTTAQVEKAFGDRLEKFRNVAAPVRSRETVFSTVTSPSYWVFRGRRPVSS